MFVTRFAPSPTGKLHVGNIRIAILNYLFTKKNNGKFYIRFDDTDKARVKKEFKEIILQDLKWLNIEYDQIIYQSDRLDRYQEITNKLIEANILYEAFETREELEIMRMNQIKSGQRPIYDRRSLYLSDKEKEIKRSQSIKPHYRFLLEDNLISFNDMLKGDIIFKKREFSDPILIREDNSPTYSFTSVIDDIDYNITHILRGEDHISNTAIQLQIFSAVNKILGCNNKINFGHIPLVKNKSEKISKRIGGNDLESLRNDPDLNKYLDSFALLNLFAYEGSSKFRIAANIKELIDDFDINNISKSAIIFDSIKLQNINLEIIKNKNIDEINNILAKYNYSIKIKKDFFDLIKNNITSLQDIIIWHNIIYQNFRYDNENKEILSIIIKFLPKFNFTNLEDIKIEYNKLIADVKDYIKNNNLNFTNRDIFLSIRLALSGKKNGIEIFKILYLIADNYEIEARLTNNIS